VVFAAGLVVAPARARAAGCGDGIVDAGAGETCDQGPANGVPPAKPSCLSTSGGKTVKCK
jgi:hypothetical protein